MSTGTAKLTNFIRWGGLVGGPILAVAAYLLLPDKTATGGLAPEGKAAASIAVLMAVWWLTEALPISATALVPIALFPLTGVLSIDATTSRYAHPLIFLFMGGFILGLGMQRWGLHKRIALLTIKLVGTRPTRLIAGFMLATAVLSMFVSNTATAIMMLPIGASVIDLVRRRSEAKPADAAVFATCLMLAIAYASSIGGLGTLIGTPPNTVLAGYISDVYGRTIGFVEWMVLGVPLVAILLPITWIYLTRLAHPVRIGDLPGGRALIEKELRDLGPLSRGELTVMLVFFLAASSWILRPQFAEIGQMLAWWQGLGIGPGDRGGGVWGWTPVAAWLLAPFAMLAELSDTGIAIAAALALFAIPVEPKKRVFAIDWEQASQLPWGVLLLFGGGLALAQAISRTGVDVFIGSGFEALAGSPGIIITLLVAAVVIFLTELTSNTAVTSALLPVLGAAAIALGVEPHLLLVTATLAASCAFMLPIATPPNAVVFSSGAVTIGQMVKTGLWLNLIGIIVITAVITLTGDLLVPKALLGLGGEG